MRAGTPQRWNDKWVGMRRNCSEFFFKGQKAVASGTLLFFFFCVCCDLVRVKEGRDKNAL